MVVFEDMFLESGGKPVEYNGETIRMLDEIEIGNATKILITFEDVGSEWRQGISLTTEGTFDVAGQTISNGLALWQDTAPKTVEVHVNSVSGVLQVKNIWDVGDGVVHSWHNGAALIVTDDRGTRYYRCNDGHPNDDFDDLVFTMTIE